MWNVKFKMKFKRACIAAIILSAFLSTNSFAQTLADAHKAYVAGNWQEAATAYEVACPKEPDSARAECYLWDILALSQTGATKLFKVAGHRLDSLIKHFRQHRQSRVEITLSPTYREHKHKTAKTRAKQKFCRFFPGIFLLLCSFFFHRTFHPCTFFHKISNDIS